MPLVHIEETLPVGAVPMLHLEGNDYERQANLLKINAGMTNSYIRKAAVPVGYMFPVGMRLYINAPLVFIIGEHEPAA